MGSFNLLSSIALYCIVIDTAHSLVMEIYYEGSSESDSHQSGTIQSPHFPAAYHRNTTVYIYYINNTDTTGGYIQLVFTDLEIHSTSSVKIYDGWNTSVASYVYGGQNMPVFHSKSYFLTIVFKTGMNKAGDKDDVYHGFRAEYTFIKYPRQVWVSNKAIPSTGFCAKITSPQGQLLMTGRSLLYNYHCVWYLARSFNWRTVGLHVLNVSLSQVGGELKILNGLTSTAAIALHLKVDRDGVLRQPDGYQPTFPIILNNANFYISLDAYMYENDSIHMAFSDIFSSWTSATSIEKLPVYSSSANMCPFKTAVKSNLRCLNYWDSEEKDGSCDYYQLKQGCHTCKCKSTNKCYSPFDVCDAFNDCGDMTSETSCKYHGERWDAWRVLILFLGAATIIFILRDMMKHRQQLWKGCKDCQCSRSCCRRIWRSIWKDSAIGYYLKKCSICRKCIERITSDELDSPSNVSNATQSSTATSASAVSIIPVSTTTILHPGRRRDRVSTYMSPANVTTTLPPAYSEHGQVAVINSPDVVPAQPLQPPSYEETMANDHIAPPCLPGEPPPAYQTLPEDHDSIL